MNNIANTLSLGYGDTLRVDMEICLQLYQEAGFDPDISLLQRVDFGTSSTRVVFAGINDTIKQALNHINKACEAEAKGKNGEVGIQLLLALWHFNHGRILTLLRSINTCSHMLGEAKRYLERQNTRIDPDTLDKFHNLDRGTSDFWKRTDRLLGAIRPEIQRPDPKEREDIRILVEDLDKEFQAWLDLWRSLKAAHRDLPLPGVIRAEEQKLRRRTQRRSYIRALAYYPTMTSILVAVLWEPVEKISGGQYSDAWQAFAILGGAVGHHFFGHKVAEVLRRFKGH